MSVSTVRPLRLCSLIAQPARRRSCTTSQRRYLSATSTRTSSAEAFLSQHSEEKSIAYLNLDRAKAKNALSMGMLGDMRAALKQVRFDKSTRALIVQSTSPGVFCAGADLKERKTMTPAQIAEFLWTLRQTLHELETLPLPTIAALDGAALGGGLELALACDFRTASSAATKLGLPETRLAIIPGAGGTQRLSRLVGPTKAKELIFSSRTMNSVEAERVGIVTALASEGQTASERAVELVKEFLPAGPLAIAAAKRAVDIGFPLDLEAGLDLEKLCYDTIIPSQDRLEGLKAFAEKRKPVYRGE